MAEGQILTAARNAVKFAISQAGFESDLTFTSKTNISKTVKGLAPVHHMQFDEQGQPLASKSATVSVMVSDLIAAGYPVTQSTDFEMQGDLVSFTDSTEISKTYIVKRSHFDNTFGNVLLYLGNYKQ
jgi:hypothetical protein